MATEFDAMILRKKYLCCVVVTERCLVGGVQLNKKLKEICLGANKFTYKNGLRLNGKKRLGCHCRAL